MYLKGLFSNGAEDKRGRMSNIAASPGRVTVGPLQVMVRKEIGDLVRSRRFLVLLGLIVLTFFGSLYVSLSNIHAITGNTRDPDRNLLYLKLLTSTDGSLPSFYGFMSFLGALLGIGLGFDAVNSEQSNRTLIQLLAQPVYRDNILLAKFIAPLVVVTVLFCSLSLSMVGAGLIITGVYIEWMEVFRILIFVLLTVCYVTFWLSLSIFFSIKVKQAASSALCVLAIWLFFTVFYRLIVQLIAKAFFPDPAFLSQEEIVGYGNIVRDMLRFSPSQLYTDATTVMLMPSIRSLGPLTMEQVAGAIPAPLPLRESVLIVWPQLSGLLAGTMLCFAFSYQGFMRKEIRS
jgi:ABC-2 type transport system permease protein